MYIVIGIGLLRKKWVIDNMLEIFYFYREESVWIFSEVNRKERKYFLKFKVVEKELRS